jgi:hypothetical protein
MKAVSHSENNKNVAVRDVPATRAWPVDVPNNPILKGDMMCIAIPAHMAFMRVVKVEPLRLVDGMVIQGKIALAMQVPVDESCLVHIASSRNQKTAR